MRGFANHNPTNDVANIYTQLDIHLVFAVKRRESLIHKCWRDDLYRYITGIVQLHQHKMLQIGGMPDHIHIFIGYNPTHPLPKLVEEIKTSSNQYIRANRFVKSSFSWQAGYSAFSHGRFERKTVIQYIQNQEVHHSKRTFRQEYILMLNKFEVDYKDEYLFDFQDMSGWISDE